MCDKVLREIEETDDKPVQDYCSESASKIVNRTSLRDVEGYSYEESLLHWPPALSNWCPRANMYYAYTEDTNPFDRIDEFIERKHFNDRIHEIHFDPPQDPFIIRDPYEDNNARNKYLRTDPACFVIFGKPGLDSEKLANLISEWWKCVLISPESLIREEIDKNTDKGEWIAEYLKNNETLEPNIIMSLIESRIKQRDVKHRGYVVEGLPLIPANPEPEYSTCPENISTKGGIEECCKIDNTCHVEPTTASLSSSADSLNNTGRSSEYSSQSFVPYQRTNIGLSARVNLLRRTTIQETLREVEDMVMIHAPINPFMSESQMRVTSQKYQDYIPEQIENIFNSWPFKPTVIIYIACPDEDAIERRENFRFDPFTGKTIDTRFDDTTESPFDDERLESNLLQNVSDVASINLRWELYKRYALPVIERQVLRHNPQNVIRVDGRTSISQMFETISTKLRSLPLSRATLPKRIWDYDKKFEGNEDGGLDDKIVENLEGTINERVFQELAKKSTISSKFRWTLSHWKFTCPVELVQGRKIEGRVEYAVRFMNKTFFLSSSDATDSFMENPRPFLASMRPRPSCKIVIFGPRYSGKSALSEALGRNLGGNVIDIGALVKGIIDERIETSVTNAIRKARNRVIKDLRIRLENERESRENARLESLSRWKDQATKIIREFIEIDQTNVSDDEAEYSKPLEFTNIHEKLDDYGLEFLKDNHELAERLKENESMIYDYAPDNLSNEEPPIRELSEHDPEVAAILENEVKHLRNAKIEITNGEIAGSLISRIKMMADEPVDGELTRQPGWIVDGMYPDPEIWSILTQADVICEDLILIMEESPYKNLVLKWKRYHEEEKELGDDENEYENEYLEDSNKIREMENYIAEIRDFDEKFRNFSEFLENTETDIFVCSFDETSKIYEIVSKHIKDRYRLEAKIITDEEGEGAYEDTIESITDIDEEMLEDERLEESTIEQTEKDNRPLGDTGLYCPVALAKNKVLRKGKKEYCALFMDKIYLCSSAEALNDFVKNPEAFNVPFTQPMKIIPFPRICIIGSPGSGKSTLAKILSTEYKMFHVDFSNRLQTYMSDRGIIAGDRDDQDRLEGIELPSDLTDKKYNDDKDTILRFYQKYKKEGASLPKKMLDECFLNFFKPPYENCGVIFDSFPNCLEDVDIALENYAVPELVIELECSLEKAQERLLPELLGSLMKKRKEDKNNERKRRKDEAIEQERQKYGEKEKEQEQEEEEEQEEGEVQEEGEEEEEKEEREEQEEQEKEDKKEYEEGGKEEREDEEEEEEEEDSLDEEFLAEAREKILLEIEETYEMTNQMLNKIRTRIEEESISWILVDGNEDTNTSLTNIQKIISPLVFRSPSIFEKTYELDPYKAEDLLECGYYLLSSFGRSCPVQMYEKKNPFQMFLPLDEKNEIYPILHRHYIYFIAGEEASKKFAEDPLKYLRQDSCDPLIPAKISIIGPPKCGKTTLAERFARAYGMRVVNREVALRWTRENYKWTRTAYEIEELSRSGREITKKLIARAIQLYSSDYQSSTQGYILDGLPDNREETEELALLNVRPMIVINLQADRKFCLTSPMLNDGVVQKKSPDNSPTMISQRYEKWRLTSSNFLEWLNKFAQNVIDVDATGSKWAVWRQTNIDVCAKFADIKRYFRESDYEKVHSLKNLCVTPYELKKRLGLHESYCPACLHYDEMMKFSGSPPDRRGIVQFREYFYWICPKHFHEFMRNPHACLPPQSTASLPKKCPKILDEEIDIEHACWAKRLVANGDCLVTYADSLPDYVVIPGKRNIGILYDDKLYLFCSLECREKFLSRFLFYAKIVIKWSDASTTMAIKNLSTLDFLEKTVADAIINSVTKVATERPKYPGISPALSAAIYIGIYLKIHNVDCTPNEIEIYEEAERRLRALRRVPVPDSRFDYLCEYFKPASKVPAFLNVVDIAGLVKGAAEGQGLGNAFLSHISACDAIFHLCRAFEDDDVTHIEGEVNPVRDLEIICEELRLKDIEFLAAHLEKLEKLVVRGNDKKLKPEYDTLLKVKNILHEEKRHIRFADWSVNEIEILNKYLFLTSKPVIYLVNLSEKDYIRKKNKWLIKIKEWVDKNDPGASLIPFSGAFENKVVDMDEAERAKYFEESKVTSALDKIIVQGYKALQLQYFFTSGADEVKAWTIQKGFKAPQAAGRIHTDFEKGFIMAEVMKFDDFKNEGSESGVKAAGKYRQQGRNYVVEDGDIIFFKFNAGAGLKDAKKK